MKNLFFGFFFMASGLFAAAQVDEPVSWLFSAKKIDAKTYEIHITANVQYGWHIYSQSTPEGGPVPTVISFAKNPLITLGGIVKEIGKLEQHFEPLFGVDVKQFSNKVDFVQVIKLKVNAKTNMSGNVEFMTCNDEMCLPPKKQNFSIVLN